MTMTMQVRTGTRLFRLPDLRDDVGLELRALNIFIRACASYLKTAAVDVQAVLVGCSGLSVTGGVIVKQKVLADFVAAHSDDDHEMIGHLVRVRRTCTVFDANDDRNLVLERGL